MRPNLTRRAMTLAGVIILSVGSAAPLLRVGIEKNGPPVSFLDEQDQPTGFTVDLLHEIEQVSPLRFELVSDWWTQNLRKFEAGGIDILGNVVRTDVRRDTMTFSIPHAKVHGVIYTRPDRRTLSKTTDFAGLKIGTLAGSVAYVNAMKYDGWGAQIIAYNDWQDAFDATATGAIDATLLLSPTSSRVANSHQLHVELVDDIIHEYRFALHPTDHQTLTDLNDALAILQANGTMDRLFAKWIGPIEPRPIRAADLKPYWLPAMFTVIALIIVFLWQRHMLRRVARHAEALRQATQILNASQELAQVGGWEVDLESRSLFWTDQTRRIHEIDTPDTPTLEEAFAFYPPSVRSRIQTAWEDAIENGHPFDLELELKTARNNSITVQVIGVPIKEQGRVVRIYGATRDITKLKQAERDRLVLSKLESTGILAGGLAHDFNNLLTVIVLNLGLAQQETTRPADQQRWLASAKAAASTAQQLIHQLITFAQSGGGGHTLVDLAALVQAITTDVLDGSKIGAAFDFPGTLKPIEGNEDQLRQVVRNLVHNARDVTPAGGTITIRGELVAVSPKTAPMEPAAPHVHLIFRDQGPGIPSAVQNRIFDPYFSTKERGAQKGMGLGLTICHSIVQQHQGTITIDSDPQSGTAVHVWLPVKRAPYPALA